jgi:hypothetical protein
MGGREKKIRRKGKRKKEKSYLEKKGHREL